MSESIIWGYGTGIGYALICLCIALVMYKLGVPRQYTRKVVHILVGFEWVFLYHFFGAGLHFLAVCIFFLVVLFVAHKGNLMPMISSGGDNAPGTVYYAVAMTAVAIVGCFVPDVMLPFGVGIFCTSIGDGFAGMIGQMMRRGNPKIYGNKTLFGSITGFVMSFFSAMVMSMIFDMGITVWQGLAIAMLSTLLEMITGRGFDNITITWGVTALTYAFMYFPGIYEYIVPILLTPVIIAYAVAKHALTPGGVVVAIVMDVIISIALGNFGFVLLSSFFVGSVLVDKVKKRATISRSVEEGAKGECRDYMQVISNGLAPTVAAFLYFVSGNAAFVAAFVAALAEAFADTSASGMGVFATKTYDPFRHRACQSGLSGGMSVIGTSASLIGAVLISLIAFAFGKVDIIAMLVVIAAAFLGAVFDSFLGSVFQIKYKCSVCGKITEKKMHCDYPTERYSGLTLIDNDVVNLLGGLFSAALAATVAFII